MWFMIVFYVLELLCQMQYDVGVVNDTQECTTSRQNNYRVRRGNDVDGDEDFADERSNEVEINFPSESVCHVVVQRRYHPRRRLLPSTLFGGRRPIHDLANVHFSKIIRKRTSAGAEFHCDRIVGIV